MPRVRWEEEHVGRIYELRRQGLSMEKVAVALGVTVQTLRNWKRGKPEVASAIQRGKADAVKEKLPAALPPPVDFTAYLYKQLPEHLQELWDEISKPETAPNAMARTEALLAENGEKARQYLFIHAFAMSNFSTSRAMRVTRISKSRLDRWIIADPEFAELMDEIHFHKKNFLEHQLLKLVQQGDTSATIFANKTLNRDRGFADKLELEVSGTIQHEHTVISVAQLDLPLETRRELLTALRASRASEAINITPNNNTAHA